MELPNKKTIGVKAKNNKICADILKPVLNKYGYKIDQVTMIVVSILLHAIILSCNRLGDAFSMCFFFLSHFQRGWGGCIKISINVSE